MALARRLATWSLPQSERPWAPEQRDAQLRRWQELRLPLPSATPLVPRARLPPRALRATRVAARLLVLGGGEAESTALAASQLTLC